MEKTRLHLIDNNNKILKPIFFSILIFYIYQAFKLNNYEILFIDERLLIDDIYNIWFLDDYYNRFVDIQNSNYKNLLILVTELAYGGDLRYGRLWSNVFSLFVGPLTFISDHFVITFARLINTGIFAVTCIIFSRNFVDKKYFWFSLISMFSLPGLEILIRIPKPEILALFFISIGMLFLRKQKPSYTIFFLSIATFIKINFAPILLLSFYFLLKQEKNRIIFMIRNGVIVLLSLIIVNPILIIPPVKIGSIQFPNFYKIYINWISSQGSFGQKDIISFEFFFSWMNTLVNFYKLPTGVGYLLFLGITILLLINYKNIVDTNETYSKLLVSIFTFYILFYFFFIERQFTWYLYTPFLFLLLFLLSDKSNYFNNNIFQILMLIFVILGNFSNINQHMNEKNFSANYKYGYVNINSEQQAVELVGNILLEIDMIYNNNALLQKDLVFWDPNLFIPRKNVTYNNSFQIREYWGGEEIDNILDTADMYVTNENIESKDILKTKIANYYVYYKTSK
jgi:hypothetical protein